MDINQLGKVSSIRGTEGDTQRITGTTNQQMGLRGIRWARCAGERGGL